MPKFDGTPYTQLTTPARGDIQGVIKDISEGDPASQTKYAALEDLLKYGAWASKVRAVTASGTVTLANTDPMFIEIDPNGADRDVSLPAKSDDNHGYFILHSGSANVLTVKRSGGASIGTVEAGAVTYVMPSTLEDFAMLSGGGGGGIASFDEIDALTEDTDPDRLADFALVFDTSAGVAKKVLLKRLGAYQLNVMNTTTFNPADATTYYIGALGPAAAAADQRRFYILRKGKITRAAINFRFTAGSSQLSTISFRLNNTTDTTLSSTVDLSSGSGNFYQVVTGLNIAVNQDDYFEIKWVTPTWTPTDPTNVLISVTLLFE